MASPRCHSIAFGHFPFSSFKCCGLSSLLIYIGFQGCVIPTCSMDSQTVPAEQRYKALCCFFLHWLQSTSFAHSVPIGMFLQTANFPGQQLKLWHNCAVSLKIVNVLFQFAMRKSQSLAKENVLKKISFYSKPRECICFPHVVSCFINESFLKQNKMTNDRLNTPMSSSPIVPSLNPLSQPVPAPHTDKSAHMDETPSLGCSF